MREFAGGQTFLRNESDCLDLTAVIFARATDQSTKRFLSLSIFVRTRGQCQDKF